MSAEQWCPIPGFDGYEVSDAGRVRSWRGAGGGRVLSPYLSPRGYLNVALWRDGGQKTNTVHRLVTLAFVGPRPDGQEVRHLNGNRTDNRLCNLQYGTRSENVIDAIHHGTHAQAKKTECPQGHEYTPENTYIWRRGRACRLCRRNGNRRRKAQKRAAA